MYTCIGYPVPSPFPAAIKCLQLSTVPSKLQDGWIYTGWGNNSVMQIFYSSSWKSNRRTPHLSFLLILVYCSPSILYVEKIFHCNIWIFDRHSKRKEKKKHHRKVKDWALWKWVVSFGGCPAPKGLLAFTAKYTAGLGHSCLSQLLLIKPLKMAVFFLSVKSNSLCANTTLYILIHA